MLNEADLVVDASCVQVICDGPPITQPDKVITKYVSTLFPSKSYKGGLPNSFQVRGEDWAWSGRAPVGGWHQEPVKKGWAGKLYLEKQPDGTYTKVWWNAMIQDKATSKPQPLPACAQIDGGPPVKDTGPFPADVGPRDASLLTDSSKTPDTTTSDDAKQTADSGATVEKDDGCSCRVSEVPAPALVSGVLLLLGLLIYRRA
jgi:MYXO-CTERM domain-containing protein